MKKKNHLQKDIVNYTFILPAAIFIIVFMFYPIVYNIIMSFKDVTISNLVNGSQEFIGLENFKSIFRDMYFRNSIKNTFVFMFFCLSFQLIFGFLFAMYFNKKFKGSRWMRAILLVAWMNPIVITGTIFKWFLAGDGGIVNYVLMHVGLINSPINFLASPTTALGSVIFANIWVGIPFNMIILLSGLQNIPEELYESAAIDGAGKIAQLRHITLPMMKSTITVLILLGFIYTFKVFDIIYAMTGGGPANASQILPYYAYELSFKVFKFGQGAAASTISFLIIAVLAVVYVYIAKKEDVG